MSIIENAKITSTMLGIEDHGIFTCFINVEGEGWGQGFGGCALDTSPLTSCSERIGTAYGMEFIARVMRVVGVQKWEDLKGTHVRIRRNGSSEKIDAIGHIIKNNWFSPDEIKHWIKESR